MEEITEDSKRNCKRMEHLDRMETHSRDRESSSHGSKERNRGDDVPEDFRERLLDKKRKRREDPPGTSNCKVESSRHELRLEDTQEVRESPDRRDVRIEDIQKACEMCTLDNDRERREIGMEEQRHVGAIIDEQFFETELTEHSEKNQKRSFKRDGACGRGQETMGHEKEHRDSPGHDDPNSVSRNIEDKATELPLYQGCRNVEEYHRLNLIAEGTNGVVYKAYDKRTGDIVALKQLKFKKSRDFPIMRLREINMLMKVQHPNIITIREVVVDSHIEKIFIVMDYVERDLKSFIETLKQNKKIFRIEEIKCILQQLLRAVAHLHDNYIFHRDLKPANLLLNHMGMLKVADFGFAREFVFPLRPYTPKFGTLAYRAPELLLRVKEQKVLYGTPVDMWSVGCIFAELFTLQPIFRGKSDIDQVNKIFAELGTPDDEIWPGYTELDIVQNVLFTQNPSNNLRKKFNSSMSDLSVELLNKFLTYDPRQRVTAKDAMGHGYFTEAPLPIDPQMFPTWAAKSKEGVSTTNASPKPPSGGREYKQLGDCDDADFSSSGFHMGLMEGGRPQPVGGGFHLKF